MADKFRRFQIGDDLTAEHVNQTSEAIEALQQPWMSSYLSGLMGKGLGGSTPMELRLVIVTDPDKWNDGTADDTDLASVRLRYHDPDNTEGKWQTNTEGDPYPLDWQAVSTYDAVAGTWSPTVALDDVLVAFWDIQRGAWIPIGLVEATGAGGGTTTTTTCNCKDCDGGAATTSDCAECDPAAVGYTFQAGDGTFILLEHGTMCSWVSADTHDYVGEDVVWSMEIAGKLPGEVTLTHGGLEYHNAHYFRPKCKNTMVLGDTSAFDPADLADVDCEVCLGPQSTELFVAVYGGLGGAGKVQMYDGDTGTLLWEVDDVVYGSNGFRIDFSADGHLWYMGTGNWTERDRADGAILRGGASAANTTVRSFEVGPLATNYPTFSSVALGNSGYQLDFITPGSKGPFSASNQNLGWGVSANAAGQVFKAYQSLPGTITDGRGQVSKFNRDTAAEIWRWPNDVGAQFQNYGIAVKCGNFQRVWLGCLGSAQQPTLFALTDGGSTVVGSKQFSIYGTVTGMAPLLDDDCYAISSQTPPVISKANITGILAWQIGLQYPDTTGGNVCSGIGCDQETGDAFVGRTHPTNIPLQRLTSQDGAEIWKTDTGLDIVTAIAVYRVPQV